MIVNAGRRPYAQPDRFDYDIGRLAAVRARATTFASRTIAERRIQRLVALMQMTYVGAPMIYYGTEAGMWGADDPCDRMPMVWQELDVRSAAGMIRWPRPRQADAVAFDAIAVQFLPRGDRSCGKLIRRCGAATWSSSPTTTRPSFLAFDRTVRQETLLVGFNRGDAPFAWEIPLDAGETVSQIFTASRRVEQVHASSGGRRQAIVTGSPDARRGAPQPVAQGVNASMHGADVALAPMLLALLVAASALCLSGCSPSPTCAPRDHHLAPVAAGRTRALCTTRSSGSKRRIPASLVRRSTRKPKNFAAAFKRRRSPAAGPSSSRPVGRARHVPHDGHPAGHVAMVPGRAAARLRETGALDVSVRGADDPSREELVQVGDRFGNHLALVYNRKFIKEPPKTTDELVAIAKSRTRSTRTATAGRTATAWCGTSPSRSSRSRSSPATAAWVFEDREGRPTSGADSRPVPALDTPQAVAAYRFIKSLRDEHGVVPANCDYELADALFKSGRAAMIINGDWSWADYLNDPEIDAAVAVLPVVSCDRPADAADGRAEGLLAQRQRERRSGRRRDGVRPAHDERRRAASASSNGCGCCRPAKSPRATACSRRIRRCRRRWPKWKTAG